MSSDFLAFEPLAALAFAATASLFHAWNRMGATPLIVTSTLYGSDISIVGFAPLDTGRIAVTVAMPFLSVPGRTWPGPFMQRQAAPRNTTPHSQRICLVTERRERWGAK